MIDQLMAILIVFLVFSVDVVLWYEAFSSTNFVDLSFKFHQIIEKSLNEVLASRTEAILHVKLRLHGFVKFLWVQFRRRRF